MSGIAGIAHAGAQEKVNQMLEKMSHRGPAGRLITEVGDYTLGVNWPESQPVVEDLLTNNFCAADLVNGNRMAQAEAHPDQIILRRDAVGVAPLYYGQNDEDGLCFASEVKGLLEATNNINELPPGHWFDGQEIHPYTQIIKSFPVEEDPTKIASELRQRLEESIQTCIESGSGEVGSWLSGGLDSSSIAALAKQQVSSLRTFAIGLPGAPDLEYARDAAQLMGSKHYEITVSVDDLLAALPHVIYHLESFDALLVRSSITNYLVAKHAAEHVSAVFSGEGGDELFGGYDYLKTLEMERLPDELIDITNRLGNTALQRVDRCSSAHGTVAYVPFLSPKVVEYAMRIHPQYKIRDGLEKWILRRAVDDVLPESVVNRPKAKFWEGAGVTEVLAQYAEENITDKDFAMERVLPNGWTLNTKEELLYYRIFREHFGNMKDLSWMGRTKGAPVA